MSPRTLTLPCQPASRLRSGRSWGWPLQEAARPPTRTALPRGWSTASAPVSASESASEFSPTSWMTASGSLWPVAAPRGSGTGTWGGSKQAARRRGPARTLLARRGRRGFWSWSFEPSPTSGWSASPTRARAPSSESCPRPGPRWRRTHSPRCSQSSARRASTTAPRFGSPTSQGSSAGPTQTGVSATSSSATCSAPACWSTWWMRPARGPRQ
mmetsp:Transcript_10434/g.40589  ORF Transcript_10434/g.40589 Transcript_10434/m.40589 type:complete len:213 (+) Transcript_10434:590-1228(+)